ncbi:MAG: hypothetical protein ACHQYP_11275 [Nitrospiria bacterium]
MKKSIQNMVSAKGSPLIGSQDDYRVIVTHLLDDLTPEQVKLRVLDFLADERGRLEFIDGDVVLCFSNLNDKKKFLVDLKRDITLNTDKMPHSA